MTKSLVQLRRFEADDWEQVCQILEPVIRAGETYALARDMSRQDMYRLWITQPAATYVALVEGRIAGTYYLKPNQAGPGSHVCNCGYIVSESARGQGVASAMCVHSQEEAKVLGFRAMQYNLVVTSNQGAVRLWKRHGFQVVGTLPEAFNHPALGYVDALVMFKSLNHDNEP